jgi:2-hydroxychromene-2-carboxylate isomerase
MTALHFYFDVSSPWTYLAFHNVQPLAAELGVAIDWRPILVGGVFNAVNQSVYESRANPVPAKARWHGKSMQDWARLAGLTIRFPPSVFPVNSVTVMRALCALEGDDLVRFARAAFEAYWAEDVDISADAAVEDLARRAGLDPATVLAQARSPEMKAKLRAHTEELIARGGFGSPTMFVMREGEAGDFYFGNDALPLVRAALLR